MSRSFPVVSATLLALAGLPAWAAEPVDGGEGLLVIQGRDDSLIGIADTASEGVVGSEQILARPLLRTGEILETVPGMVVTQHSGTGKANQYFLRGFNLDHGTDFATTVDGMPVNMPSHGHGQGYTDLNFIIPELVDTLSFRKGVYDATHGDFASAGSADLSLATQRAGTDLSLTVGMDAYARALVISGAPFADGNLLYAIEALHYDGPWDNPENLHRGNAMIRYGRGDRYSGWSVTAMGYGGDWDATDQIPQRAVDSGEISRLGTIDPSVGGRSWRFSLSGQARFGDADQSTVIDAYAIRYGMDLWSNFTYFLEDPVNGDQFEQVDRRWIFGGAVTHSWIGTLADIPLSNEVGLQLRNDLIDEVGLHRTANRQRLSTVRTDEVFENALGVYATSTQRWTPWFRTTPGIRADLYRFDVDGDEPLNAGTETDGIVSPKLTATFGPWSDTEFHIAAGLGFHSNDARGTTITVEPGTVDPVDAVDPLVRTRGGEIGVRSTFIPGLHATLTLWTLAIDSELLFVGDGGTTEASRPSRRTGFEWTSFWTFAEGWTLDADAAWTRARFTDEDPAGDRIPGSVDSVVAAGITYGLPVGWFGSLRLRWLGERPLIEDDSERSDPTVVVNAEVGYRRPTWSAAVAVLNLFDSTDHDIDYFYESQLASEGAGVEDVHFHPVEPLTVRATVSVTF